jgi:peptidoglycan biosynthesis protein MviN/MurJ (putative lipid II flippase)
VLLVFILKRFQLWEFSNVGWMKSKKAWSDIGFMQVNILPVWIRNYATLYLLSGLGNGIITSVIVAQQIALVIDVMFTNQVLSVVGIKLNECNSKKDFESANKIFILTSNILLFLILPCVTLVVIYSHEILSFLFAVKSFDNTSAANIELCLRYLIILAPFNMLNGLCTRFFTSFQIIDKTIVFSIIAHISFLILAVSFINIAGLHGYLYSQIAGFSLLIFLFYVIIKREFPFVRFDTILFFAAKQIISNLLIAIVIWQLNNNLFFLTGISLLLFVVPLQFLIILIVNYRNPLIKNFKDQIYVLSNKTGR